MRSRFCRCCKDFHDTDQPWPEACVAHFGARTNAGPQIISDTIEPFRSHADGKMYSSKSRYRADLRARGLIEVGNERMNPTARSSAAPVRQTLQQTMRQLGG